MTDRLIPIDTTKTSGSQFPTLVQDEIEAVVVRETPGSVTDYLGDQEITFTDEGDGEGYFSVGGVPVSGTLVPPAATWSGIAGKPELMTALYTSFPGKSDGAIPSFGDEGVAVTHRGGFGDNLRLVVADGLLQAPDLSGEAGDRGAYWNQPLTGVKRIGATFKLSSGATENGAIAAFVLWSEPIPEPYAVPDSPFHMIIGADFWSFDVYESGSITSISSAYFKYPLADDWNPEVAGSGTEYRFEGWINGDTVTLALPDGSTAVVTDSRIESIAATVACHELYRADGSSGHAAFQRIWADTGEGPVGGASLIDVTRTVRALQAPLPVLGANLIPGGSFAVADSYADTTPGEITTDQAYTGTHSWEVTSTGEFQSMQLTRNSSGVAQRVETQPGRIFRWEAQLRKAAGNTGGGNLTLGITAAEEDGTDISSPGLKVIDATSGVSSAAWTTVSGYGTTPADTCFVKLQFALSGAVPADDVFYIDSVILEDVTETFRLNRTNFSATTTSTASLTIDSDTVRRQDVTALATNMTINAPTGTPASGQELTLMIVDDGTPRTLTWNSAWASRVGPLPTATLSGKNIYVQAQWTASIAKWVVLNMSYGPNTVGVKVAVPSTTSSAGVLGEWAADASHFYVCTAANTWRRVAVGTW